MLFLSFSFMGFSQGKSKAETPLILQKLQYHKTVHVGNYDIVFKDVITDSRCPQGVTCVWAGSVIVDLELFKNEVLIATKRMEIPPSGFTQQERMLLAVEGVDVLFVYGIKPKRIQGKQIAKETYYILFESIN
ncbi:hypothetical protein ACW5R3_02235 [Bizionia sp. KMM 8389]